jgi:predicted double-glycine peptidase
MVAVYILGDTSMNPYWMAQYSEDNKYVDSNSTLWSLMAKGASSLGLDVTEIPLDEQRVADNLEVGNPIICIMGPGDFTTSGHFIVLTSYEDGMVTVNDPNSIERSNKKWPFADISSQIRNLWVYRKKA